MPSSFAEPNSLLKLSVSRRTIGGCFALSLSSRSVACCSSPLVRTINRAENVDDFDRALGYASIAPFNWVVADADDILYRVQVDLPDRGVVRPDALPYQVLPGGDASTLWSGAVLGSAALPRSRNPDRGYLVTANNDPWGFTSDGDVTNDPFYYGAFYAPGYRAQRIEERLVELLRTSGVTSEDMQALQRDVYSTMSRELLPLLSAASARAEDDDSLSEFRTETVATLVELLTETWNGKMQRDSAGALAFHVWAMKLNGKLLAPHLIGPLYSTIVNANGVFALKISHLVLTERYPDSAFVLAGRDRDAILLEALVDTAGWLIEQFRGVEPSLYTWGDAKGTRFDSEWRGVNRLNFGFIPTNGGEDTVDVSGSRFLAADGVAATRFDSTSGALYRMVAEFDEEGRPRMLVNWPLGNSADPDSPYWSNELEGWVEGRYEPFFFDRDEVEAHLASP